MRGYRNPHPGDLREQIDILRETNTINANGYPVPSYEVVHKKLWAGADDAGNQAFRASDSEIAQNVINFVVRHRSDIEVGMFGGIRASCGRLWTSDTMGSGGGTWV